MSAANKLINNKRKLMTHEAVKSLLPESGKLQLIYNLP